MRKLKSKLFLFCALVLLLSAAPVAQGDWDPEDGHKMHYPQLPKLGGWDVAFNQGRLADDWECTETGPVTDIHFWVSWQGDQVSTIGGFSVRIWSDDPCGPQGHSEPNELLWERDFDIGDFNVLDMPDDLQGWHDPILGVAEPEDHIMWQQINIVDIINPHPQNQGEIYWLEIDMPGTLNCGWKQSGSPQFLDDAVVWDSPLWEELYDPETAGLSMDLAFVITGETTTTELDFGDANDPCYPTLLPMGARHIIGGPYFGDGTGGDAPDAEADGQPTPLADGDDLDTDGDDEDGVSFQNFNQGQSSNVSFEVCNASANGAWVQIWIDWDGSGTWEQPAEQVYNQLLTDGNYSVSITAPGTSTIGLTFARCRISTAGALRPDGLANDGEVEDHTVTIEEAPEELDFGDAPDPTYPTLLLPNDGARHVIVAPIYLGAGVDSEPDGQPDATATGDDLDVDGDDEDGVVFTSPLIPGTWATVDVNAGADGLVDAWVDFGGDGSWAQPVDQIFASEPVVVGVNPLIFWVPFGAQPGSTFARFRFSTNGGLSYTGLADDGEVEDYEIDIEENPSIKWIQLPDTSPNGIDIMANSPRVLADDFECTSYGPITDVHLWGSWKYDEVGEITRLHLSFHSDDPIGPGGSDPCNLYSKPDRLLWERDFFDGDFDMLHVLTLPRGEFWWDPSTGELIPSGDYNLWRVDAYIDPATAFFQEGEPDKPVIYWLDVQVETSFGEFGWKTRKWPEHFEDDAVFHFGPEPFDWKELRYPEGHPLYEEDMNSIDMAFALTGEEWEQPKEPTPHLKWSQPPIEIDPGLRTPLYCGWDEPSFWLDQPSSTLVYENVVDPYEYYHSQGMDVAMADDMQLAGIERLLDHYEFEVYDGGATVPYTVTSELYDDVGGLPGTAIAGTFCSHVVTVAGIVRLDCTAGPGVFLPDNVWMVLTFSDPAAGWLFGETAEVGFTSDLLAFDDGIGWYTLSYPSDPYGGMIASIWCYVEQPDWGMMVADDFRCLGSMPITSVHWWGSYLWWDLPEPPPGPNEPNSWRIGFWSNVPAVPGATPSYPETLLWEVNVPAEKVEVEWVGDDFFPSPDFLPETCFQYNVKFDPNDYFWQDRYETDTQDNVFWMSIAPVYPAVVPPIHTWGWKTRPWSWMDDAVVFQHDGPLEPGIILDPAFITPIEDPEWGESFDVAFELDTDPNYIKWEQPFTGFRHWRHYEDEESMAFEDVDGTVNITRLVADDWPCEANTPITAASWWGSYIGYRYQACTGPVTAPPKPDYFLLSIWTDVPDPDPGDPGTYSYPGQKIWDYNAFDYDEVLVGYDKHPEDQIGPPQEPVFRYSVRIREEEWFCQDEPNDVYWFSVVAVYKAGNDPLYPWGWTNHEHVYNDDAVAGTYDAAAGWFWEELYDQTDASEDMSFILFTEPDCFPDTDPAYANWVTIGKPGSWCCKYQHLGDCNGNGLTNIQDLIMIFKPSYNQAFPSALYNPAADCSRNMTVNIQDLMMCFKPNYNSTHQIGYNCEHDQY